MTHTSYTRRVLHVCRRYLCLSNWGHLIHPTMAFTSAAAPMGHQPTPNQPPRHHWPWYSTYKQLQPSQHVKILMKTVSWFKRRRWWLSPLVMGAWLQVHVQYIQITFDEEEWRYMYMYVHMYVPVHTKVHTKQDLKVKKNTNWHKQPLFLRAYILNQNNTNNTIKHSNT